MDLETIEMEKGAAREALRQYRADVKAAAERSRTTADRELAAIDAAVMRGYRELARGNRLLKLSETIAAGGVVQVECAAERWEEGNGRMRYEFMALAPGLAITRADARSAWLPPLTPAHTEHGFAYQAEGWMWNPRKADVVRVPGGVFDVAIEYGLTPEGEPETWMLNSCRLKAMAPTIPPALRPRHALRNYFVIWEAEWTVGSMIPPGDPALLRHMGGDLYAVMAVWDLSPLERAVLGGVRGS